VTCCFERRFSLADHMKVMGAGLDNGLLHVDVVREVPEAAKLRTIKIGTTVETVQPQLRKLHAQLSHRSAPARDHDRRKSGSHRTLRWREMDSNYRSPV
jgi:hypothetical protein